MQILYPCCKLPPQDRGVGKIRDAKTEQTMTKIRDAKTEQTMTSQECLRMSAQKPVKGGQPSPFLNLLIQKPFISQSQHTIEVIVQLQKE